MQNEISNPFVHVSDEELKYAVWAKHSAAEKKENNAIDIVENGVSEDDFSVTKEIPPEEQLDQLISYLSAIDSQHCKMCSVCAIRLIRLDEEVRHSETFGSLLDMREAENLRREQGISNEDDRYYEKVGEFFDYLEKKSQQEIDEMFLRGEIHVEEDSLAEALFDIKEELEEIQLDDIKKELKLVRFTEKGWKHFAQNLSQETLKQESVSKIRKECIELFNTLKDKVRTIKSILQKIEEALSLGATTEKMRDVLNEVKNEMNKHGLSPDKTEPPVNPGGSFTPPVDPEDLL